MIKSFSIIVIVLGVCACATVKDKTNQEQEQMSSIQESESHFEMQKRGIDFSASGIDSDWLLEIDFDKKVRFTSPKLNHDFEVNVLVLGEGLKGSEATHEVISSDGELTIGIQYKKQQLIHQAKKPFDVIVKYVDRKTDKEQSFSGEGVFYGDIRLHDSWLLDRINGIKIDTAHLDQYPHMDIYLDKGKAMGFMGCNSFSSDIYFGRNEVCFSPVLSTKMACMNDAIEPVFSKAISNKVLKYRFDDLYLILENATDTLVFVKDY
ncbi:META domain-containing protein [Saccharicrinis fermentans]|uniref:META domain protein n=1 Tax=Saccharicrinis fermentans DSM 9555 = JCM 21142 TaxID=869213 RepID=W7Y6M7_9BACT|nr:META domain-containing protein [Saccharicrinis fermentans]GAF03887.1 META domain protein [Saccharicrinis fermentans DSM 9555 = JCM 21142]